MGFSSVSAFAFIGDTPSIRSGTPHHSGLCGMGIWAVAREAKARKTHGSRNFIDAGESGFYLLASDRQEKVGRLDEALDRGQRTLVIPQTTHHGDDMVRER